MELIDSVLSYLVLICNLIGISIILYGIVFAVIEFFKKILFSSLKNSIIQSNEIIRFGLGSYLVLSLEFFIASDIMKSIVIPEWKTLGFLGAIVAIRIILSYFLDIGIERYIKT